MSLTKVRMMDIVKKQYLYKLKAYSQVFMSLVILQLIAVVFSLNGIGSMGTGSGSIQIEIRYYSADFVVAFTILWGFITAIIITTQAYRNDDFAFVTNRLSNNLANMLFLLTASIIGGITAILSSYLMKLIAVFFVGDYLLKSTSVLSAPAEFIIGLVATTLYLFLFCALGYLVGTLVQISRVFVVLLPALVIGTMFIQGSNGSVTIVQNAFTFFFTEPSLLLFFIKIIVSAGLLLTCAGVLSNRMEVRQ